MQQQATGASDVVPGARFCYGTRVFAVEGVPADGNSLFQAVLNSGLLPNITVQKLRQGLITFATGSGRELAQRLMFLFSDNMKVKFDDYMQRKLGTSGVEGDNFEVVLLAVYLNVNLIVFKQSSAGIAVFNVRYFLSHEAIFRSLNIEIPASTEIYLFQRQIRFGINNAVCNHFLYLRLLDGRQVPNGAQPTDLIRPAMAGSISKITSQSPRPGQQIRASPKHIPAKVIDGAVTTKRNQAAQSITESDYIKLKKLSEITQRAKIAEKMPPQWTQEIFNAEIGSDFRLLVGKEAFFVHRKILCESCNSFRKFLDSRVFTEQLQNPKWNGRDIILRLPRASIVSSSGFGDLTDSPSLVFRKFLELLYNLAAIGALSTPSIAYIALVAHKMKCDRILQLCDLELSQRMTTFLPESLSFSRRLSLQRLRKKLLLLFGSQTDIQLILKISEQNLSEYFETVCKLPPVKMMTVALVFLCGLDSNNRIRKRGDFYEISRRIETCRNWVTLFAKRCKNSTELSELYAVVSRVRLVHYDGRYDDVCLRDAVMLALTTFSGSSHPPASNGNPRS